MKRTTATIVIRGPYYKRQKTCPADDLICPITLELPFDPVMAEDGRIYDRSAIEKHIEHRRGELKSPMTNLSMGSRLVPVPQTKNVIDTLVEGGFISGELATKPVIQYCAVTSWANNEKQRKELEAMVKGAEGGDAEAMFQVGLAHFGQKDGGQPTTAISWLKKAHDARHFPARAALDYYYAVELLEQNDHCDRSATVDEAIAWFQEKNKALSSRSRAIRWLKIAVMGADDMSELKKQAQQVRKELEASFVAVKAISHSRRQW
jgi:U-box domain